MQRALAGGMSAAEAAQVALENDAPARGLIEDAQAGLLAAAEAYDEVALLAFGLMLRSHGWRIPFLGANTPISILQDTAQVTAPAAIVPVAFDAVLFESEATALRRLGRIAPLSLSGPGATADLPRLANIRRLDGDLVAAADVLARMSNQ